MHIKHIHETLEKLSGYACEEASKSVECINTCELGSVVDMIKDLAEAEYYAYIAKEMTDVAEEEEAEEKYMLKSLKDEYGEDDGKRYYDMWRYKSGRFAPKGRGTRRGYDEPPYYHMNPDMYKEHDPEYWRDLDRSEGRLYFSEPVKNTMNIGNTHDKKDGRSWKSRRGYMESKELHKSNTPEDKQHKMHDLEEYAKELTDDVVEMISDMSAEEKNLLRAKLQTLVQKIQ